MIEHSSRNGAVRISNKVDCPSMQQKICKYLSTYNNTYNTLQRVRMIYSY